jgi:hypothetical protein
MIDKSSEHGFAQPEGIKMPRQPARSASPFRRSQSPAIDGLDCAYPAPVDGAEGGGTSFWQGIVAFFDNLFSWLTPASTAHAAPAQASPAASVQTQALGSEGERQVVITYLK